MKEKGSAKNKPDLLAILRTQASYYLEKVDSVHVKAHTSASIDSFALLFCSNQYASQDKTIVEKSIAYDRAQMAVKLQLMMVLCTLRIYVTMSFVMGVICNKHIKALSDQQLFFTKEAWNKFQRNSFEFCPGPFT